MKVQIEIKWAVVFALMTLAWMALERAVGLHDEYIAHHANYTNFYAIPAIAIYVFALLEKRRKDLGGYMSYKQGVISGLIMTIFIALLSPLTQYITSKFIAVTYFPNVIEYSVSGGFMERAEAEEYFSLSNYMFQSVIGALIMGLVTTIIVTAFVRKSAPVS